MFICVFTFSCSPTKKADETTSNPAENRIKPGRYQGNLEMQQQKLPFEFAVLNDSQIQLINGKERIALNAIELDGDSLRIPMHIFDASLVLSVQSLPWKGYWVKHYAQNYRIPATADRVENSQNKEPEPFANLSGKWSIVLSKTTHMAVGNFSQKGSELSGTIMTSTGDYRYLNGQVLQDSFWLSTFDGEHAFLFKGNIVNADSFSGHFYSGKTWHETFGANRNPDAMLPNADTLTYLKPGYKQLAFSAKSISGEKVSLQDPAYANKPVLLQIMGTWCPNCMDETAFLAKWKNEHEASPISIIALAFERKNDFAYAKERLEVLQKRYNIPYTLAFAGSAHKDSAAAALPALNHVWAYPTLIYLNRDHEVVHIHTGFQGPGTGEPFLQWKKDFTRRVERLLP